MTRFFAMLCVGCVALAMSAAAVAVDDGAAEKNEPLAVGQALPDFESISDNGQPWKSADNVGHKILVLYFYPGDFTGGCSKQALTFREGLKSLEDLNVEVVGVSGDSLATHQLFRESHGLRHTLLADPEGALAAQLGIPARRTEKPATVRASDLDRQPLLDETGNPIIVERRVTYPRWTVIVDKVGKVASKRTQVNPSTDADEVRKIVESLPR